MNYIVRSILMAIILWPAAAQATPPCSNPSGDEGDQVYNTTYHVMQYCNGSHWVAMGSVMGQGDDLGGHAAEQALNMSGFRIENLALPTADNHAVTRAYVTSAIAAIPMPNDTLAGLGCATGQIPIKTVGGWGCANMAEGGGDTSITDMNIADATLRNTLITIFGDNKIWTLCKSGSGTFSYSGCTTQANSLVVYKATSGEIWGMYLHAPAGSFPNDGQWRQTTGFYFTSASGKNHTVYDGTGNAIMTVGPLTVINNAQQSHALYTTRCYDQNGNWQTGWNICDGANGAREPQPTRTYYIYTREGL